jgi:enterochelin esterase family protein
MRNELQHLLASSSLLLCLNACSSNAAAPIDVLPGQGGASAQGGGAPSAGAGGVATTAGTAGMDSTAQGGLTASSGAGGSSGSSAGSPAAGGANTGSAGSTGVVITDPGTDGDGEATIGPSYVADPANLSAGAPVGHQITFVMSSADSKLYPGINGKSYMRSVWVYIPAQYVPGTAAPYIVVQDGDYAVWFGDNLPHTPNHAAPDLPATANLPRILDNLIAANKLPKMLALIVDNGGGDAEGSERGLEYDTVSGKFAEYIETEVVPRVLTETKSQLQIDLKLTDDPQGHATLGGSSGGAASFSMAWWHPEYFARVLSYSGTFVRQASPEDPLYPHGCWSYHDYDPYNAAAPNGLIMKEPTAKPLRVWLEDGQNDSGAGSGPGSYRDFRLANERMAASLQAKGYHYHHDNAQGAGHFDGNVVAQTLPTALEWLWRGYPLN